MTDDAFVFDLLEALKPHFPKIAFCFARGTGGIERQDILAIIKGPNASTDVGEVFDLNGLKKLWRTGVETGRILQQADAPKVASDTGAGLLGKIEAEARRYASHYPQGSDGQNTFVMFADYVAALATPTDATDGGEVRPGVLNFGGGRFAEWSSETLAAQCRMQARDSLDPDFMQLMEAVAVRLATPTDATDGATGGGEGVAWEALRTIDRVANRLENAGQPHSANDLRAAAKIVEASLTTTPGGDLLEQAASDRQENAERALRLWFFRELTDDQRHKLFALWLGEIAAAQGQQHGVQRHLLRRLVKHASRALKPAGDGGEA